MNPFRFASLVLACAAMVLLPGVAQQAAAVTPVTPPIWETDYVKAVQSAEAGKKLVLLDFTGSDWCPDCSRLEKTVFSQPRFQDYAREHFVLVRVDFPRHHTLPDELRQQNEALAKKFEQRVYPTIVLLGDGGEEMMKFPFEQGSMDEFMSLLEKAVAAKR